MTSARYQDYVLSESDDDTDDLPILETPKTAKKNVGHRFTSSQPLAIPIVSRKRPDLASSQPSTSGLNKHTYSSHSSSSTSSNQPQANSSQSERQSFGSKHYNLENYTYVLCFKFQFTNVFQTRFQAYSCVSISGRILDKVNREQNMLLEVRRMQEKFQLEINEKLDFITSMLQQNQLHASIGAPQCDTPLPIETVTHLHCFNTELSDDVIYKQHVSILLRVDLLYSTECKEHGSLKANEFALFYLVYR